jgi:hypothetical protein
MHYFEGAVPNTRSFLLRVCAFWCILSSGQTSKVDIMKRLIILAVSALVASDWAAPLVARAAESSVSSLLNRLEGSTNNQPASSSSGLLGSLTHDQVALGLKQALTNGVQAAIKELGHDGGFLTNVNFRIPLPKQLKYVEDVLRSLKEEKLADQFVASMNHAAEKAVPEGAAIFAEAISHMTIADTEGILRGQPDAATQFFRRNTETNLYQHFMPIVKKATDATGVTANYKKVMTAAGSNKYIGGLLGAVTDKESLDLDHYVTEKALDGLFKRIAEEEKRIRADPVARTTDLLKQVFGAVKK